MLGLAVFAIAFLMAEFHAASTLYFWIGIVELATALVVIAVVQGRHAAGAVLRLPAVRTLGLLSYGLYVWHYPVDFVARIVVEPGYEFPITMLVSLIFSMITYHLVEKPFRGLRRRTECGRGELRSGAY